MRNAKKYTVAVKAPMNESRLLYGEVRDKRDLHKCDMVPTDCLQCNVRFRGKSVYTKCSFRIGDIIEVCPVRKVTKNALYSREVRDMTLEVIPNEEYVIPLGYCQYYDVIDKSHPEPNCSYEWNPRTKCIIIRAIQDIPKDTVLVLGNLD